jgi:hypothetical protein
MKVQPNKIELIWILLHTFSAFSRRMWLRAIKHRTENVTIDR